MSIVLHVLAGSLALLASAVALASAKGARLHRQSGQLFVGAMLVMALTGAALALTRREEGSVLGGMLAAYLVLTGMTTVRRAVPRWLHVGPLLLALAVGLASATLVATMVAAGERARGGVPVPMFVLFGAVALGAAAGDLRVLSAGPREGARRLRRHLWRMCFATFIATGSFFLGQMQVFPPALRVPALLAVPAFLPLALLGYWLLRTRARDRAGRATWTAPAP